MKRRSIVRSRALALAVVTGLLAGAACTDSAPLDQAGADGGPEDGPALEASQDATPSDGASQDATSQEGSTDGASDALLEDARRDAEDDADALDDGPDLPPALFPSTVPKLFGYDLVDAFPAAGPLFAAMDVEWVAGSTSPFYLHRQGYLLRLPTGGARQVVLDFSNRVYADAEAGALGMALHPKFTDPVAPKPYVFVWYTFSATGGASTRQRLSRFTYDATAGLFDPTSEQVLIEQTESTPFHNGAHIRFGPDGFLYLGNGDDQRPGVTTQTLTGGLFSGIFRIDVDMKGGAVSHAPPKQPLGAVTSGYFVPNDNPFVGMPGVVEEYYALGFRNPYAFNFDKATGALWLGDVGDTFREELDRVVSGGNYQWPFFEGKRARGGGPPAIGTSVAPVFDYSHASIGDLTATMSGYVYRGAALPEVTGKLVFSDWPTGRVWALDTTTGIRTSLVEHLSQNAPLGWGQDAQGELYMVTWSRIEKLVRATTPHGLPPKLSETHLFRNLRTLKPSSSLVPYDIRSPLWSDASAKQRFVYLPPGKKATMTASGTVTLPVGALLIKQFDLPGSARPVAHASRLETRVLVVGTDTTYPVSYRWNAAGTEADLVLDAVDEHVDDLAPSEARDWHFPSQGECFSCHRSENRVLGFRGEQLDFNRPDGRNQLTWLAAQQVLDAASLGTSPAPLVSPADTTKSLGERASAYLAANCSSCHHPGASFLGSGETWNATPGVPSASRGLLGVATNNAPMAAALGLAGAPLIAPGNPSGSLLLRRMQTTDPDLRMPPLARTRLDPLGESLVRDWIAAGAP